MAAGLVAGKSAGAEPSFHTGKRIEKLRMERIFAMDAMFVELPAFQRHREAYLDDAGYRTLQQVLLANPEAGPVIPGAGGLRKLRFADARRGKGRRGGLRVIYYWWAGGPEFWLLTLYDKDEAADLTSAEKTMVRELIKAELAERAR